MRKILFLALVFVTAIEFSNITLASLGSIQLQAMQSPCDLSEECVDVMSEHCQLTCSFHLSALLPSFVSPAGLLYGESFSRVADDANNERPSPRLRPPIF